MIKEIKKKVTLEELCNGLMPSVYNYLKYVKGLAFDQEPDY